MSLDGIMAREKLVAIWLIAHTVLNDHELLLGIVLMVNGVLLSLNMEQNQRINPFLVINQAQMFMLIRC